MGYSKQDIIESLYTTCDEAKKEFLDMQGQLNRGSECANRFINSITRKNASWGVYVDKNAVKTQTAFLAGMIAGIEYMKTEIDQIEGVMHENHD